MPPLRLCHVASASDGAVWLEEQLRELRDRFGYDVTAIVSKGDGTLAARLEAAGVRTILFDFDYPGSGRYFGLLRRVRALAAILSRERFDIIQSHLFASMVLCRLAAWLADVPVRLSMIAGPYHLEAVTPRWIDRGTAWMETALIGSCRYTCRLYREMGIPDDRLELVYYGPDPEKFDAAKIAPAGVRERYGWPPGTPVIGMVAYFYPKLPASRWTPPQLHGRANKRQEDLLRAVPRVREEFPDARFLIVGRGWGEGGARLLEETKALARELGVSGSVVFTGFVPDVPEILVDLDVSVQLSLSENLGGTIESLLCERPLVATRVGGMVDSVKDGVTGVLVPPLEPEALADAVCRILRDPDRAREMARAGRALMLRGFTLDRTVAALDGIYRRRLTGDEGQPRAGYRKGPRFRRLLLAVPVFAYLAGRLAFDVHLLPRLRPIPDGTAPETTRAATVR